MCLIDDHIFVTSMIKHHILIFFMEASMVKYMDIFPSILNP